MKLRDIPIKFMNWIDSLENHPEVFIWVFVIIVGLICLRIGILIGRMIIKY
jgi:hypothetical protein